MNSVLTWTVPDEENQTKKAQQAVMDQWVLPTLWATCWSAHSEVVKVASEKVLTKKIGAKS